MPKIPRISEVEWEIMRVIWERSPISASEIIDALVASDASWHPKTAKTLLNRLVKKGALGFSKEGRLYLYRPLAAEKDCVDVASASFLNRAQPSPCRRSSPCGFGRSSPRRTRSNTPISARPTPASRILASP